MTFPCANQQASPMVSAELSGYEALIVAAYGQILRPETLYAASEGAWNVHASLLPKHRGAAPVERAIMAGETKTGVTIIRMDEGLDTGPMALQRPADIPPDMNAGELTDILAQTGAKAIVEGLKLLQANTLTLVDQDSRRATYASKLSDRDRIIGWGKEVGEVHNQIRALAPHIGARTFYPACRGTGQDLAFRGARPCGRILRGGIHRRRKRAYRGVLWERLPRGAGAPGTRWPAASGARFPAR